MRFLASLSPFLIGAFAACIPYSGAETRGDERPSASSGGYCREQLASVSDSTAMRQYARDCPEELLRLAQEQASLAEQARRSEEELSRLRRENAQLHNKLATERQDGKDKLATCERKRTQLLEASGPYVQGLERSLADLTEQNRSLKQALQDRCNGSPPSS